jgi:hypothetical protein
MTDTKSNTPEHLKDRLTNCVCCGSNACYESQFKLQSGILKTWLCMTCGFTTNETMEEESETLKQAEEHTADFIRDLKQVHLSVNGKTLAWFPTVITMPEKGMIFPEPIEGDWKWTVVKSIAIPEEDRKNYPIPDHDSSKGLEAYYKNRMDMENPKRYEKLCFMDAAEELGMFDKTNPIIQ